MSRASFGKPLKGVGTLSAKFIGPIEDTIFESIAGGNVSLNNVEITGGTIDGVVIGGNSPGPGTFTTLQTGNSSGQGFIVCFYGQTIGESACWEPVIGRWNIQGDLLARDISDLGNLRISVNTLSSTNTNGNITIDPDGSGTIVLSGPLSQSTSQGNITFNTSDGLMSVNVSDTITTLSGFDTSITTNNGNIILNTGLSIPTISISFITTGSTPTITTTTNHLLSIGDTITVSGTNSIPDINGIHIVTDVLSTTTFRITLSFSITNTGTSGNLVKHNDIFLTATNNVNIPVDIGLTFKDDNQKISSNSSGELTIISGEDINLTPSSGFDINIPDNIGITFGSNIRKLESDGTNINLDTDTGDFIVNCNQTIINGDLLVDGNTTYLKTVITIIDDPVLTLGGDTPPISDDNKDRGIEFRWNDGNNAKTGFFGMDDSTGCFTYIPDATNNDEVFSGNAGCAIFGALTSTSLNIQGGTITNVSSLSTCSISCSTTMNITASTGLNLNSPSTSTSGNLVAGGNFTVNGTTTTINSSITTINSSQVTIDDLILTLGGDTPPSSDDDKDRGIEFRYHDGVSSKLGFFGWDDSQMCFTFFSDATNTNDVISGSLGDLCINDITSNIIDASTINASIGNITTLNSCSINCSGTMTITAIDDIVLNSTNLTVGSSQVTFDDLILTLGGNTPPSSDDNKDRGIEFRYHDGVSSKLGFFGWDDSQMCFTFFSDATNTNDVISGTLGDLCINDVTSNIVNASTINSCNINCSGTMTITAVDDIIINSTNLTVGSSQVTFEDIILTLGGNTPPSSDDNKDRGIEFRYHDGVSSKLGFFGWDDSQMCFTFFSDATNTNDVISGTLGNLCINNITSTEITTTNAEITGTLDVCNINCNDTLTITASDDIIFNTGTNNSMIINSFDVSMDDLILTLGGTTVNTSDDSKDRGIEFRWHDNSNPKLGFFGRDSTDGCFKYIPDATNTDNVISGDLGCAKFGDTEVDNLTVNGTITVVGGASTVLTTEHLSATGGGVINPSVSINVTFISITSSGIVTGTLNTASSDGFPKYIMIESLVSGAEYHLSCPSGILIDPGSGSSSSKTLKFEYTGQSIYIIYNSTVSSYIIVNAGVCIE